MASISVGHAMPRHVDVVLKPAQAHEDCVSLERGQPLQYHFTLDPPGRFELYYRDGKQVGYALRSESVREQKGDYVAPAARRYCLRWRGVGRGDTRLGYEFIVVEPGLTKP
jgi:hypothetical protein